jgi:hypothetical protein
MATFAVIVSIAALPIVASGHDVTTPTYGPTSYDVRDPLVASNGQSFLALWTVVTGSGPSIYESVVDSGGHKTTLASFQLLPFSAELVDLTAFGSDYLVMWKNRSGLHTSVVSGAGAVLRDGPTIAPPTTQSVHVHTNGRTVLFTYHTNGPLSWPTETRAQLTTRDGTVIGAPVLLANQALQTATPFGDDYITITTEQAGTYFLRLDKSGNVVVPKRLIAPTQSLQNIAVASNGNEILVATPDVFIALSGDGTVLKARSIEPALGSESSLTWTGDSYLHIRRKGFSAVAQHLDRLGMPLGNALTLGAGVSSIATHDGVVYAAGRTEDRGIVGFALTAGNALLNGSGDVLSITPTVQTTPVLASDGVEFLAGWREEIAPSRTFAVTRVSRAASPIDGQPINLGPVAPPERTGIFFGAHHSVACAGQTCLAVWEEESAAIRGRFIVAGHADPNAFVIGNGHISDQAAVWNGGVFFVIWNADGLHSASVLPTGAIVEQTQLTVGSDGLSSPPSVAWNGHDYLLMFTFDANHCDCVYSKSSIYFAGLRVDGTLFGQDGFFANFSVAHLTSNGHDFLVIYDYRPLSTIVSEVATRRVVVTDAALQIEPAIALFQWFAGTSSTVTWNGKDYIAAWRYGSNQSWWLAAARITTSGFTDRQATASGFADRQVKPAIAANDAGEIVIAVSEAPTPGDSARLRAYSDSELTNVPPTPAAPYGVYTLGTAASATVRWQSDGRDVAGFVVQRADDGSILATVAPSERSVIVSGTTHVQVRAFNAGGMSGVGYGIVRGRASR